MEIECYGEVQKNEIVIFNRSVMKQQLRLLEGKNVEIIIREKFDKRTIQQNKYYWAVVIKKIHLAIYETTGDYHKPEDIHQFLRQRFNSKCVVNSDTGESIEIPKSTTDLDIIDFIIYIDKCKMFALEFLNLDIDKGDL